MLDNNSRYNTEIWHSYVIAGLPLVPEVPEEVQFTYPSIVDNNLVLHILQVCSYHPENTRLSSYPGIFDVNQMFVRYQLQPGLHILHNLSH